MNLSIGIVGTQHDLSWA